MRADELALGCTTLTIAAAYYLMALRIQQSEIADVVGPQGLPKTYAALLALLSAILIVRSLARGGAEAARVALPVAERKPPERHVAWRIVGMLMNGVLYVLLVPWLGYVLSIAALIAATVYYQGGGFNRRVALVSMGGAVFLWLLFVRLLHIAHPAGIWPSLL